MRDLHEAFLVMEGPQGPSLVRRVQGPEKTPTTGVSAGSSGRRRGGHRPASPPTDAPGHRSDAHGPRSAACQLLTAHRLLLGVTRVGYH